MHKPTISSCIRGSSFCACLALVLFSFTSMSAYAGSWYDRDGDGVSNWRDDCRDTPTGTVVDSRGCPIATVDSDGDGINDDLDACPNQGDAGYGIDASGCPNPIPDSDNDGLNDSVDACPNLGDAGYGVDINGCPNPIPDSDGDGLNDSVDACPSQGDEGYGVDTTGCPNPAPTPDPDPTPVLDADGDGVSDDLDACPNQGDQGYGLYGNGCPKPAPATSCVTVPRDNENLSILGECAEPADCHNCHKDTARFPVFTGRSVANRHHASSLGQECLTCHALKRSPMTGMLEIGFRGNCLEGCHLNMTDAPTNEEGLPLTVIGSPASGTNRHHYTDTFKNGSCHQCHVFPETELTSSEICMGCHDGSVAQKDIIGSFNQAYSHPLDGLGQSANGVQVSCLDCHNPNKVTSENRLRGVQGVEPNFPGNFQEVGSFEIVESVEKQYQLCFKCHSANTVGNKFGNNFATNPPKDASQSSELNYSSRSIHASEKESGYVTLSGWDGSLTDQAKEFNPNNNSYHPVVAPGKNDFKMGSHDYSSSLINGWKPDSLMVCADCHRDSNSPEIAGPHGSGTWPIASAPFTGNTGGDAKDGSGQTFTTDMCFKCHDRNVYGYGSDSSKDDGYRTGFSDGDKNLHYYHVEGKGAQCTTCHSAVPHGWKRKALLIYGAGQNPDPAPYNNHAKYPYAKEANKDNCSDVDKCYSYGINSATPIDSIQSGQWRKEVCHDAGGGTGDCK